MSLLFISQTDDPATWTRALEALLPDLEVRVWPDLGDPEDIEVALVWKPPPGELKRLPRLRLIHSLGMGVDHIFCDSELPPDVPVVRLVDENIVTQMSEYLCHAVLHYHRRIDDYEQLQREKRWRQLPPSDTAARRVGILGLGVIGCHTAENLITLGFPVLGWSRSPKAVPGVQSFHGSEDLAPFLSHSDVLVCLLPLTPDTRNLLDEDRLKKLPEGAYLINCGRGACVVEEDLLAVLDSGRLAGATLDVFRQEPLPPAHPFWTHPKVRVTPHVAGLTNPRTAAPHVAENIRRLRAGRPLLHEVGRSKGY